MSLAELAENFELFDDWEDRYRYIIDLGRKLPELTPDEYTDENLVRGCISRVWLVEEVSPAAGNGSPRLHFRADSDAAIVRGLIAVLLEIYNDQTPAEILAVDLDRIFAELDLSSHISPNRRNGFVAMVERIHRAAQVLQAAEQHRQAQ